MLNEALGRPVSDKTFNFPRDRALSMRALLVGDRLHLRGLYEPPLALAPLVLAVGEGAVMLFRYGAVVFCNITAAEQAQFLRELAPRVQEPFARPEIEETELFVSSPETESIVATGGIGLHDYSLPRLKLVAIVLARSVALARYESAMTGAFDMIEPLATHLEREALGRRAKDLLHHVGGVLLTQHKMVGRVEIQDKPELLWEQPQLEYLYVRLEAEYELRERSAVLERKLDIISRTAETAINLLHNRRMLRVEWYIVALIVIEVMISVYEIFWRHT